MECERFEVRTDANKVAECFEPACMAKGVVRRLTRSASIGFALGSSVAA